MAGIKGAVSLAIADVLAASKALHSRLMSDDNTSLAKTDGAVTTAETQAIVSAGAEQVTGVVRHLNTDHLGRQGSSQLAVMFQDANHSAGTLNAHLWQTVATTQAVIQSALTGKTLNSGSTLTINTGVVIKTWKRFKRPRGTTLVGSARVRFDKFQNSQFEIGFGDAGAAATGQPASGILDWTYGYYFRYSHSGTLIPVLSSNGVDAVVGTNFASSVSNNTHYDLIVAIDDGGARFICVDSSTQLVLTDQYLKIPVGLSSTFGYPAVSFVAHVRVGATVATTASRMYVGDVFVGGIGLDLDQPYAHLNAGLERGIISSPGSMVQTQQWANSAQPTAAALSNTVASYGTLGGKFLINAVAGAETDYALFAQQNTEALSTGMSFYCTGVRIDTSVGGAAIAGSATVMEWFIYTSSAASLATADARRSGLGMQSFAIAAPIGAVAAPIDITFKDAAVVLHPMRFLGFGLRIPTGTATGSQTLRGLVLPFGYWA